MSETQTASLTDFLLARIAEDEAVARAALAHERALLGVKPTWSVVYAWAMMLNTPNGAGGGGHNFQPGSPSPSRVLARCKADRRIVEWDAKQYVGYGILEMLALPYADHPDYRAEWAL